MNKTSGSLEIVFAVLGFCVQKLVIELGVSLQAAEGSGGRGVAPEPGSLCEESVWRCGIFLGTEL